MKKRKTSLKITAAIVAFLLIGGILFISNAFVGNPISAWLAKKEVERYVQQNYHFLDLELDKPKYNFKDSTYVIKATSPQSIDTRFSIAYRNGEIVWDDYDNVLNKRTTLDRLAQQYSLVAKNIVANELGFKNNRTYVLFADEEYERIHDDIQLDMEFTKKLPLKAEVTIFIDEEYVSFDRISTIFSEAHEAFLRENCQFTKYHLYIEKDESIVMINHVTSKHIESGQLTSLLMEAENNEKSDIHVFIKTETN